MKNLVDLEDLAVLADWCGDAQLWIYFKDCFEFKFGTPYKLSGQRKCLSKNTLCLYECEPFDFVVFCIIVYQLASAIMIKNYAS